MEILATYLPPISAGLVAGFLSCIMLAWAHRKFMNLLAPILCAVLPLAPSSFDNILFDKQTSAVVLSSTSWVVCFAVTFGFYIRSNIKQGIPFSSILSGSAKELQDKKNEYDAKLKDLDRREKKLNETQKKSATEKERLYKLDEELRKKELELLSDSSTPTFEIISDSHQPIFNHNILNCSTFHARVVQAISRIGLLTDHWTRTTRNALGQLGKKDEESKRILTIYSNTQAYLQEVSMHLNNLLVQGEGTRVFFRIQSKPSVYRALTGYHGSEKSIWKQAIRDMPYEGSLIQLSHEQSGKPVVYSLNKSRAIPPRGEWEDFITIAPPQPNFGNRLPLLTLCISVEDSRSHINFFKFLCHIRFDKILRKAMKEYFKIFEEIDDTLVTNAIMVAQNN